ncbi:hypothetical protein BKA57DRAFT_441153 [Linnemannia elongata]|nr:hypothetical protein BKA57DRAFT_441153 [Linnemannia elongata]
MESKRDTDVVQDQDLNTTSQSTLVEDIFRDQDLNITSQSTLVEDEDSEDEPLIRRPRVWKNISNPEPTLATQFEDKARDDQERPLTQVIPTASQNPSSSYPRTMLDERTPPIPSTTRLNTTSGSMVVCLPSMIPSRLRSEDRINQEAEEAEGSRRRANVIALPDAPQSSVIKCSACGQLGHRRTTHPDCLVNPQRLLIARPNAYTPPTVPVAFTASASFTAPAVPPAVSTAPAAPAPPDAPAPAPPATPSPAPPATPAPPAVRVFGNGLAAHNEQDDTVYRTLGRMNVVCSYCGALHWIEMLLAGKSQYAAH